MTASGEGERPPGEAPETPDEGDDSTGQRSLPELDELGRPFQLGAAGELGAFGPSAPPSRAKSRPAQAA